MAGASFLFSEDILNTNIERDALNHELAGIGSELAGGGDFLRGILSGCGDCIKILDLDGRLQFMSEGGKRVMEVDDFAPLKGCPWPDFWTGEGNAQAAHAVAEARWGRAARFRNHANTAKGNPRYWDVQVAPIFGSDGKVSHIMSISRDITEEWKAAETHRQSLERAKFLAEELVHRVKNTLATVLALANQSFKGEQFKEQRAVFNGRIQTLSDAYNLLTEHSWTATSMRAVVEGAMAPYRTGAGRITITGPDHEIAPAQALTLALALNELGTNATKYGALSVPEGKLSLSWTIDPALTLEWRESGGPQVTPPARTGFGSRMIKTMLAKDFGGTVELDYEPSGVVCRLDAPRP
jgi:two-component sensor histidine kinase